ncbi:MAG: hypothetical protein WA996_05640 [Candidatus Promineifilaceae bacterium]
MEVFTRCFGGDFFKRGCGQGGETAGLECVVVGVGGTGAAAAEFTVEWVVGELVASVAGVSGHGVR